MAGMNTLGKGKTTGAAALHPFDPNKYQSFTTKSKDDEDDPVIKKMVEEVEAGAGGDQMPGWLKGRGAFDMGDAIYLQEEDGRSKEEEYRRSMIEDQEFARFHEAVRKERGDDGGAPAAPKIATKPKSTIKPQSQLVSKLIKVKPKGSAPAGGQKRGAEGDGEAGGPASGGGEGGGGAKKPKGEGKVALAGLLGDYGSGSDSE